MHKAMSLQVCLRKLGLTLDTVGFTLADIVN